MTQRPTFTLAEAATLVGVSRSSIRRRLDKGAFSDAYKTSGGIWKIPLTDLLAAGLKPVSGTASELSHELSGDISQAPSDIGHDISQGEQQDLKNRVIELENALSVERAHRAAAEQVAMAERSRAQTAERALRMLEQLPTPLYSNIFAAAQEPDPVPSKRRRWFSRSTAR